MDRSRSSLARKVRLLCIAAAAVVAMGLGLALLGLIVLVAHPVTGPELRDYLRDRYLRPWSKIPDRPP